MLRAMGTARAAAALFVISSVHIFGREINGKSTAVSPQSKDKRGGMIEMKNSAV